MKQKIQSQIKGVKNIDVADVDADEKETFDQSKVETRDLHTFDDGSTYEGEWMGEEMHGKGTLVKQGETYVGEFRHNLRSGTGKLNFENGDSYDGKWKHDQFNGQGTFVDHLGNKYSGHWVNMLQNGDFEDELNDGSKFKGEYEDGKKIEGETTFEDGAVYNGQYKHEKFEGKGEYNYANGLKYKGEYHEGLMQGKGVMTWPDGKTYDGDWELDQQHGFGILSQVDGKKYDGGWKFGKRHGEATVTFPDGSIKIGVFEKNKVSEWYDTEEINRKLEEIRLQKEERERVEAINRENEEKIAKQ